ncbi:hypothetical protein E2C06_32495, partial [Dankookia rubra]
ADLVIVHEWTDPWVVAAIGRARRAGGADANAAAQPAGPGPGPAARPAARALRRPEGMLRKNP